MNILLSLIFFVLQLFQLVLLARVLMTWLPNLDRSNSLVQLVYDITEPVLKPIRDVLPPSAGMDFSPLVAFLIIYVLQTLLRI